MRAASSETMKDKASSSEDTVIVVNLSALGRIGDKASASEDEVFVSTAVTVEPVTVTSEVTVFTSGVPRFVVSAGTAREIAAK